MSGRPDQNRVRSRPSATVLAAAAGIVAVVASVAGCSIQLDDAPRDIPVEERRTLDTDVAEPGAGEGATRIFLVAPAVSGDGQVLRPVQRDSPNDVASALRELLQGPNDDEAAAELTTALPSGLELLSATRLGDTVVVDVSGELLNVSGEGSILAVAQIVSTASEVDGIANVQLRVDGASQAWAGADGELITGSLSIYDYPGLIESSQPDYPGIPTR